MILDARMRSIFLTLRFIVFAFLLYFSALAFGFAVWNIVSMQTLGLTGLGSPIFIIFNSVILVFCVLLALAELFVSSARTAQVSFECGWTGLLSTLQLGAAVNITVSGPPMYCGSESMAAVCASSFLLVILSWLSCAALMAYFLTLLITSFSHWKWYGNVWSATVYTVPWFTEREVAKRPAVTTRPISLPPSMKPFKLQLQDRPYHDPIFDSPEGTSPLSPPKAPWIDVEKQASDLQRPPLVHENSDESLRPTWAKSRKVRRGLDRPFALPKAKPITTTLRSYWSRSSGVPSPPPKPSPYILPQLDLDLYSGDSEDGSQSYARSSYSQFPDDVADPDKPISHTRPSQWIRADAAAAVNMPSTPHFSPQ